MKKTSLLIAIYFFVSCSSPNKIPDDIIGIDKMKLICWDLIRAGKLSQVQYERTHRIYFNKAKPLSKDTGKTTKKRLADTTLAMKDSALQKKDTASLKTLNTQAFQQVFNLYHITKEEFYKSYRYYEEHPDKNSILLDSISAYGGRQRQQLRIKEQ